MQGKQLNLGIHLKDTVGSQTRSHSYLGLFPHPPPSAAWSSSVCHSECILCKPALYNSKKYSCHSIPKRHRSPKLRGSPSGLQFQLLWVFSSFGLNSHARREGRRQGHCYRGLSCHLYRTLVPRSAQCIVQSANPGYLLHNGSNSLFSSLFRLLSLHLPK